MSVDVLLEQLRSETYDRAHADGAGQLRLTALVEVILERLEEVGITPEGYATYCDRELPNAHAEVHGYTYDVDDEALALYYVIDANAAERLGASWTPQKVGKDLVDRGFRRLVGFMRLAQAGRIENLDESDPAEELATLVRDCAADAARTIELHVVTTGHVSERAAAVAAEDGHRREVWDLTRLERTCGTHAEQLSIDFVEEFGTCLDCLVTPPSADGIQVLLASIPGSILASLYNKYRGRLLERNVRSFLQFTAKVNKGIRLTLLNEPSRFLSYNNGISATASSVDLEMAGERLARIRSLDDFQVVNGGQTTATIASCVKRDGASMDAVSVAMKLTVMGSEATDQLVPLISRYANTQNRIQEADFHANDPWHVGLERMSRHTWTSPADDAPRGTRWYYERSRGQYPDELAAHNTQAGRRQFRLENPTKQKFRKTDVAKYRLSWAQQPSLVSRGGEKCHHQFMLNVARNNTKPPDGDEFQQIVGEAILFKTAERLYGGELGFTGYRAQVVTYSVARLSRELHGRMNWATVWSQQALPDHVVGALTTILVGVREAIINPPANRNITEWCKTEDCWSRIVSLNLDLIVPVGDAPPPVSPGPGGPEPDGGDALRMVVQSVPAEVWYGIAKWAKETDSLQKWQRGLSFSLGRLGDQGRLPSVKQAIQGRKLLLTALEQGFHHDQLTRERIQHVEGGPSSEIPDA